MIYGTGATGQGQSLPWEPPIGAVYLWRSILLEEPGTNPWEFACKLYKMTIIGEASIWDAAEWADRVQQEVRWLARRVARSRAVTNAS